MNNFFFVWHRGEGGDFLMALLNYAANDVEPTLRDNGRVARHTANQIYSFTVGNNKCIRAHFPFSYDPVVVPDDDQKREQERDYKLYEETTNKKTIVLQKLDTDIWIKKVLYKMEGWDKNISENKIPIDRIIKLPGISRKEYKRQLSQILKSNLSYTWPIWAEQILFESRQYEKKMIPVLQKNDNNVIQNNMITVSDITACLHKVLKYMDLNITISEKVMDAIEQYAKIQNDIVHNRMPVFYNLEQCKKQIDYIKLLGNI
mgnify:CR=1 FL=1|tara:strand:+ start:6143 stop:6922 length:780 start_codon:yes stop_codon:yes gene_type:complete